jgi:glucose-1-phosphate thymidylyltransferase
MADTIMRPETVFAQVSREARAEDDVLLALFATTRPEKFGMVRMDPDGYVREIVDKPRQTDLTHMWGCIIWRPRFTEYLHESVCKGVSDFANIMNGAIEAGMCFRGVIMEGGTYIDLGTYEEIAEMEHAFLRGA